MSTVRLHHSYGVGERDDGTVAVVWLIHDVDGGVEYECALEDDVALALVAVMRDPGCLGVTFDALTRGRLRGVMTQQERDRAANALERCVGLARLKRRAAALPEAER